MKKYNIWKKTGISAAGFVIILLAVLLFVKANSHKEFSVPFDADYYWTTKTFDDSVWFYETVAAGFEYYLYIPPQFRKDRHNENARLPLIVTFHGSNDKYSSRGRFGRMFIDKKIQDIKNCAVLVLHSRGDYFTDCYDVCLLIGNLLSKNECIDRKCIIGFGHSQGAEFVVKLACYKPSLFKAVISGSGYYQPSMREVLRVRNVNFYWKISKYDKGIYEQGYKTGRKLKRFCKNSVNIELESREHCWVEIDDKISDSDLSFLDWFRSVVE
ncbi:hypothetical protein [Treponema sp. C6A8]|uniref:hypothetical protein n=1 Tax=Treponema sp. C6A8 TaxID=1410609 RepID=UPI0004838793|nr:hypothetical protein [Treponema sp. C6A8]